MNRKFRRYFGTIPDEAKQVFMTLQKVWNDYSEQSSHCFY